MRPRRSVLFMPASNARALDRAKTLAADALIFDLEDAVAPDAKEAARAMACAGARSGDYGQREVVIRVNALATAWGEADLAAVARAGAHAVLLPKVEDAGNVREALRALTTAGAPESLALWCMLETPRGILRAEGIAAASPRVAALVMWRRRSAWWRWLGRSPNSRGRFSRRSRPAPWISCPSDPSARGTRLSGPRPSSTVPA